MKLLTGIKLVNWHYFTNETVRLSGSTLLTGENGAGKSTLLDAVQFLLVGDTRRVRFNVSAHEETRRTLDGYLRGRTGTDTEEGAGRGCLRRGDFTTHLALEFHDTRKREHFLLGCAIDCYASGEHEPPRFYKIEKQALDDRLFLEGDRPRSARELRALLQARRGATVYATAESYRADLLTKLGHLGERFCTLLVKALAFRPITDVRRFVYDYLLDAQTVQVDAMRENMLQYRQFEVLAEQAREKVARLEEIRARHEEKRRVEEWIAVQDYVILRAEREGAAARAEALAREQEALEAEARAAGRRRADLEEEERRLERTRDELRGALHAHDAWRLLEDLGRQVADLERREAALREKAERLLGLGRDEARRLEEAGRLAAAHREDLGLAGAGEDLEALGRAPELWRALLAGDWDAPVPAARLEALARALGRLAEAVRARRYALEAERRRLEEEAAGLRRDLESLRRKRLVYDEPVLRLRERVALAVGAEPRVLCEVLEIPDERWQDAVEGYLNTQRFDLLVPPEHFDAALYEYERRKREDRIHNVGLINTGRVLEYAGSALPGSLAEEVRTEDPYARAYVDRLLGRLMKCETEQDLKRHSLAITPTCMTYRNHTARQIPFHVYENWYIGERALVRQRERKEARLGEVAGALAAAEAGLGLCAAFLERVGGADHARITDLWEEVAALPGLRERLSAARRQRDAVDVSEIAGLEREIGAAEAALKQVREERERLGECLAELRVRLEGLAERRAEVERERRQAEQALTAFVAARPEAAAAGDERYREERRRRDDAAIADGFRANRVTNQSRVERLRQELFELRVAYNTRYQFGGAPGAEDNGAYDAEHRKLTESELPAYGERIARARAAAEQEFKEHFVYKLREQIERAEGEFRALNAVLRTIEFGRDRYQFQVGPGRQHKHFYDMIMDPLALEGSLFSAAFQERHRPVIDELFALILDAPAEELPKNIETYTDFRTYLDFDIRIEHADGGFSSFSRVCREKSGGETQTPFYVAVVASFLQLYRPQQNEDSARLILFDEAFNRMDPDRAENTLELIRRLGVQVIAAAPTDKCELLSPHLETTLLVLREGDRAWVEDYHQALASRAGFQAAVEAAAAASGVEAAAAGEAR